VEFKEGVRKINTEFQEFFSLMFGGGNGSLSIIEIKKRRNEMEEDEAKFSEADRPTLSRSV